MIPVALQTLNSLAQTIERGEGPPAELILLPDGGELKPEKIRPVLDAFARLRTVARDLFPSSPPAQARCAGCPRPVAHGDQALRRRDFDLDTDASCR